MGKMSGSTSAEAAISPKEKYDKLYQRITNLHPQAGVSRTNVLLYGATKSGKSSFINSVDSIFGGYLSRRAPHGACQGSCSVTKNLKRHAFVTSDGVSPKFCLWDCMGWNVEEAKKDELTMILEGFVPDKTDLRGGVSFRDRTRLNSNPTLDDKMHSILFVVPCHYHNDQKYLDQLNTLKDVVFASEMQPLILLTMIDDCGVDIPDVMESDNLEKIKKDIAARTGVPRGCILPIKNFDEEREICSVVGLWVLEALNSCLNNAQSFIRMQSP